jgi:hypothetical protein
MKIRILHKNLLLAIIMLLICLNVSDQKLNDNSKSFLEEQQCNTPVECYLKAT